LEPSLPTRPESGPPREVPPRPRNGGTHFERPVTPRIAEPKPLNVPLTTVLGVIGSVVLHGLVLLLIVLAAIAPKRIQEATPIEVAVVETVKPPPPPPPEPPPEEQPPEPEPVKPKPKPQPKLALPPPPKDAPPPPPDLKEDLPPPPNETPPPDAKPKAPIMIGISMSSTTAAGSFSAPVGNTLYGQAPAVAKDPSEVKPYASPTGRYVPPYKVTKLPKTIHEVKAKYPEEARKLGLEGQVVLRLTVDTAGKVVQAKVIRGAGNGFDEAALAAVTQFRFEPGTEGDEAVVPEITYTYTFLLD